MVAQSRGVSVFPSFPSNVANDGSEIEELEPENKNHQKLQECYVCSIPPAPPLSQRSLSAAANTPRLFIPRSHQGIPTNNNGRTHTVKGKEKSQNACSNAKVHAHEGLIMTTIS